MHVTFLRSSRENSVATLNLSVLSLSEKGLLRKNDWQMLVQPWRVTCHNGHGNLIATQFCNPLRTKTVNRMIILCCPFITVACCILAGCVFLRLYCERLP